MRTHTTAVLFSDLGEELLTAFNAAVAPGLLEKDPARLSSPEKYFGIEHSERPLFQQAAKRGLSTDGKTVGCSVLPFVDCARATVGTGIKALLTTHPDFSDPRWGEEFRRSHETLTAAGAELILIDKQLLAASAAAPARAQSSSLSLTPGLGGFVCARAFLSYPDWADEPARRASTPSALGRGGRSMLGIIRAVESGCIDKARRESKIGVFRKRMGIIKWT